MIVHAFMIDPDQLDYWTLHIQEKYKKLKIYVHVQSQM